MRGGGGGGGGGGDGKEEGSRSECKKQDEGQWWRRGKREGTSQYNRPMTETHKQKEGRRRGEDGEGCGADTLLGLPTHPAEHTTRGGGVAQQWKLC